jgi:hypothetical protein
MGVAQVEYSAEDAAKALEAIKNKNYDLDVTLTAEYSTSEQDSVALLGNHTWLVRLLKWRS